MTLVAVGVAGVVALASYGDGEPKFPRENLERELKRAKESCPDAHIEFDSDGIRSVYGCMP